MGRFKVETLKCLHYFKSTSSEPLRYLWFSKLSKVWNRVFYQVLFLIYKMILKQRKQSNVKMFNISELLYLLFNSTDKIKQCQLKSIILVETWKQKMVICNFSAHALDNWQFNAIGQMIVEDNYRAVKMLVYVSLLRQVVLTLNLLITLFLTLFSI